MKNTQIALFWQCTESVQISNEKYKKAHTTIYLKMQFDVGNEPYVSEQ